MNRKYHKPSPEFEAKHMVKQEEIKHTVDRRQAEQTKEWKAGKLRIAKQGKRAQV